MTKTKKGFLAGLIVLAMTLALAFGFALVPSAHVTAYAADLPALSNVQLVGNTLSWDAFTGATEYQVQMVGLGGNGSNSYTTNSADLSAFAADYHCETGTYNWEVYAVDEHGDQISLTSTSNADYSTYPEYDYNVSYAQYSTATDLNSILFKYSHVRCSLSGIEKLCIGTLQ